MGLFGKLFDKKSCAICGGEIGLLGNRKLEDGNCCKNCAAKLSPLFSERRHSTVEDIKAQLAYREENQARVAGIYFDKVFGKGSRKLYLSSAEQVFCVSYGDPVKSNADVIALSAVTNVAPKISESKSEIYTKDAEGKRVSYDPKRYEYSYGFSLHIDVTSPWFDDVDLSISNGSVDGTAYEELNANRDELSAVVVALTGVMPELRTFTPPKPDLSSILSQAAAAFTAKTAMQQDSCEKADKADACEGKVAKEGYGEEKCAKAEKADDSCGKEPKDASECVKAEKEDLYAKKGGQMKQDESLKQGGSLKSAANSSVDTNRNTMKKG